MASQAKLAHGTKFQRSGVSVLEVTKIGDIEIETESQDVTNADSGGWKESLPGLMSMKDVAIEGNLRMDDATGQMALAQDQLDRSVNTYGVVGPAAIPFGWSFSGWVKSFKTSQPQDGVAKFSATIEVTGNSQLTYSLSGDLTALACSIGTIAPALAASLYEYGDVLTAGTASVTVTATKAGADLSLYKNGVFVQALTTAVASAAIATPVGTTKIGIRVQETGKVAKWYTLNLYRAS